MSLKIENSRRVAKSRPVWTLSHAQRVEEHWRKARAEKNLGLLIDEFYDSTH
jgi:hypothetical protein